MYVLSFEAYTVEEKSTMQMHTALDVIRIELRCV